MVTNADEPVPVFKKCARCRYSLRGLPANHACPECGLRFDERCALYRVTNPKQVLVVWSMMLGLGVVSLRNLPYLADLSAASAGETVAALLAALSVVFVPAGTWFFIRRYRRGFDVAITSDGLMLRLPDSGDDLIPWKNIGGASIKERRDGKAQVASILLKDKQKSVDIGGDANVFPKRSDVERFVQQVNERVHAANGPAATG